MSNFSLMKFDKEEEHIILVDENDTEIGTIGKIEAHRLGRLHRAFSVFIFNAAGELLLQRRALSKYHSGGLWSNTCCGHPRPGESNVHAARRRLREEMGIDCECKEIFSFLYQVKFDNNIFEHEYDHVLLGTYSREPRPNPEEACEWKWITIETLKRDMLVAPDLFTFWMKISIDKVISHASI